MAKYAPVRVGLCDMGVGDMQYCAAIYCCGDKSHDEYFSAQRFEFET